MPFCRHFRSITNNRLDFMLRDIVRHQYSSSTHFVRDRLRRHLRYHYDFTTVWLSRFLASQTWSQEYLLMGLGIVLGVSGVRDIGLKERQKQDVGQNNKPLE